MAPGAILDLDDPGIGIEAQLAHEPFLDLRVDDHSDPLRELERLYRVSLERYQPFVSCLATRASPAGITDRAAIEDVIAKFQKDRAAR